MSFVVHRCKNLFFLKLINFLEILKNRGKNETCNVFMTARENMNRTKNTLYVRLLYFLALLFGFYPEFTPTNLTALSAKVGNA